MIPETRPRSVFVVAYGRSGSTLLQGLLNTLPATLVRGENKLFVLHLFRGHDHLRRHRDTFNGPATRESTSAFYGLDEVELDPLARGLGDLVNQQLLGDVDPAAVERLGFKEVGWHRVRPEEEDAFLAFLDQAFDRPLFILNRRDPETTSTSGFWRLKDPDVALQKVQRVRDLQDAISRSRPDRALEVHFEAFTSADPAVSRRELVRLAEFVLGAAEEDVLAAMTATLGVAHGPKPFGASRTES